MFNFGTFFASLFGTLRAKVSAFFAGPGGLIVKQAFANMVKIAGAEAASLLVQMASNNVNGRPVLTDVEWKKVAEDLRSQAIANGITTTESLLDYAIGQAVAANAVPGALPSVSPIS